MEIFYAYDVDGKVCRLDGEESAHLVRVLRRRSGDEVHVIDGEGTLYRCRLTDDNPKGAEAAVLEKIPFWGAHPYRLTLGCCPTKNNERFEWMVEKAVEIGVDCIVPLIGERSERKVYKTERARRIALSATKQSLKAALPEIREPLSVSDLAQRFFLDKNTMTRQFKRITGMTPGDYIRRKRLESNGEGSAEVRERNRDRIQLDRRYAAGRLYADKRGCRRYDHHSDEQPRQ